MILLGGNTRTIQLTAAIECSITYYFAIYLVEV
jgi:hypothetical protein